MPFGMDGPRICIGMSLAKMNITAVTALLLSRFKFRLADSVGGCVPGSRSPHEMLHALLVILHALHAMGRVGCMMFCRWVGWRAVLQQSSRASLSARMTGCGCMPFPGADGAADDGASEMMSSELLRSIMHLVAVAIARNLRYQRRRGIQVGPGIQG